MRDKTEAEKKEEEKVVSPLEGMYRLKVKGTINLSIGPFNFPVPFTKVVDVPLTQYSLYSELLKITQSPPTLTLPKVNILSKEPTSGGSPDGAGQNPSSENISTPLLPGLPKLPNLP